ncbi:MAG: hypothetical protein IKA65_05045 [Lentisphaeria bacterium]|nr:hypothetical protein [Lentisphaeria bacterium]
MVSVIFNPAAIWILTVSTFSHSGEAVYMQLVAPTIIWGKASCENGKNFMPVTVSINHAAADGYHIGCFFKVLQQVLDSNLFE